MFFLHTVMDLRALVANMANSDEMPWSKFQLVTSAAAYELAQTYGGRLTVGVWHASWKSGYSMCTLRTGACAHSSEPDAGTVVGGRETAVSPLTSQSLHVKQVWVSAAEYGR